MCLPSESGAVTEETKLVFISSSFSYSTFPLQTSKRKRGYIKNKLPFRKGKKTTKKSL